MKKINYEIVGRFEYGSKYGVISRKAVEGQQIDEYAAVRKQNMRTGSPARGPLIQHRNRDRNHPDGLQDT